MSIYTSQIKTHIIDPVYDRANSRAEYRLDKGIYLTSLRLLGLGAVSTGDTSNYSDIVGALGVIKQISLYDDNQLLDQLLESSIWLSFKSFNTKNQDNMSLKQNLVHNMMGNQFSGYNIGATQVGQKVQVFDVRRGVIDVNQPNATTNATTSGYLSLKDVFPLLKNLTALNTETVFKNLKIVVEYHSDSEFYVNDTQRIPYSTIEAQLVADEVVGDMGKQKFSKFEGVSYSSIEHDRVNVPAVLPTDTVPVVNQSQTLHVNGFNNKTLGRMLIVKTPTDARNYKAYDATTSVVGTAMLHYGKTASKAFNKEVLQIRVNGSSLIAGRGITGDNQRLGMLSDVWGKTTLIPFGNGMSHDIPDGSQRAVYLNDGSLSMSELDYYGININKKVEDLQIDFSRECLYSFVSSPTVKAEDDAATVYSNDNQAIQMNVFCEVYKQIQPTANGYNVVYL